MKAKCHVTTRQHDRYNRVTYFSNRQGATARHNFETHGLYVFDEINPRELDNFSVSECIRTGPEE